MIPSMYRKGASARRRAGDCGELKRRLALLYITFTLRESPV